MNENSSTMVENMDVWDECMEDAEETKDNIKELANAIHGCTDVGESAKEKGSVNEKNIRKGDSNNNDSNIVLKEEENKDFEDRKDSKENLWSLIDIFKTPNVCSPPVCHDSEMNVSVYPNAKNDQEPFCRPPESKDGLNDILWMEHEFQEKNPKSDKRAIQGCSQEDGKLKTEVHGKTSHDTVSSKHKLHEVDNLALKKEPEEYENEFPNIQGAFCEPPQLKDEVQCIDNENHLQSFDSYEFWKSEEVYMSMNDLVCPSVSYDALDKLDYSAKEELEDSGIAREYENKFVDSFDDAPDDSFDGDVFGLEEASKNVKEDPNYEPDDEDWVEAAKDQKISKNNYQKRRALKKIMPKDANVACTCEKCGKSYVNAKALAQHMKLHSVDRNYSCKKCDQTYKNKLDLKQHLLTHADEETYACSQCDMEFLTKNQRYVHFAKQHRPNDGPCALICEKCGKSFSAIGMLKRHLSTHTTARPYSCGVCQKTFKLQRTLQVHSVIHNGPAPYMCSMCGKGFTQKYNLTIHERIHSGALPFSCPRCGKGYRVKCSMLGHLKKCAGKENAPENTLENTPVNAVHS